MGESEDKRKKGEKRREDVLSKEKKGFLWKDKTDGWWQKLTEKGAHGVGGGEGMA